MSDPRNNLPPAQQLMAFADGELDAEGRIEVLRRLAADPSAAKVVENEIRLRQAARRSLSAEPGPSPELSAKVASMVFHMSADAGEAGGGRAAPRRHTASGWRFPASLAASVALLAAGLLAGRFLLQPPTPPEPFVMTEPFATTEPRPHEILRTSGIPAQYVAAATQVHVKCSHADRHAAGGDWPAPLESLREPVKQYVGGERTYPDLSHIGFNYLGCAPCGRPNQHGAHLLYRSQTGTDTLSLFVERFDNQVAFPPDECRRCVSADGAHPVLAWRSGGLFFLLVGNGKDPVEKARLAMKLPNPL